jgi:hypothetical protein
VARNTERINADIPEGRGYEEILRLFRRCESGLLGAEYAVVFVLGEDRSKANAW